MQCSGTAGPALGSKASQEVCLPCPAGGGAAARTPASPAHSSRQAGNISFVGPKLCFFSTVCCVIFTVRVISNRYLRLFLKRSGTSQSSESCICVIL